MVLYDYTAKQNILATEFTPLAPDAAPIQC